MKPLPEWMILLSLILTTAFAGDPLSPADEAVLPPLDFKEAVEIALNQSPMLREGMIRLQVRRLDERDGRAKYWPSIYMHAEYLIDAPETVTEPFSIRFSTGEYNPVDAYFSTRAQRYIVQLAELAYLEAIADGLHQAGDLFLTLAMLEKVAALQAAQMEWADRNVTWWSNRLDQAGAALELQIAEQERTAIALEGEKVAIRLRQARRSLSAFLGMEADDRLPEISTDGIRAQLLDGYPDTPPNRDDAETRSLDLRRLDIQMALQELGVKGAYAEYLPRPTFTMRTTDPLNDTQEQGLYFFAGLSLPLWDAGRRSRNVLRQKSILMERELEQVSGKQTWRRDWGGAGDQADLTAADAALARQRVRLAELNLKRHQYAMDAGREAWPDVKAAQQHLARMKLELLDKSLQADRAELMLRHLSRELLDRYVSADQLEDGPSGVWLEMEPGEPE